MRVEQARRRFLLVFNPTAGMSRPRALDRVRAALAACGASVIEAPSTSAAASAASVIAAIEADSIDAVLAAGGDGTIRRVATVAAPRGVPVGIVPLGTGNVMAHEIGLPTEAAALVDVLVNGPIARVRGGMANTEPFFLWTGAGFDGRVVSGLDHGWKRRLGKLAYARAITAALQAKPDALEVAIDGIRHRAAWAIVTNASRYAGSFVLTRRTRLVEPGLVTLLFNTSDRGALVRALGAIALGRLAGLQAKDGLVAAHAGRSITITSQEPVPVQVDGDPAGTTPLDVTSDGPELALIVPPSMMR